MLLLHILLLALSLAQNVHSRSKYVSEDEDNPYEFGFTIDGQQHRHEKKEANGIIQGEFGFITADGVYHVTVYATDENGDFKILSMRNIKISGPLDQPDSKLPDTSNLNTFNNGKRPLEVNALSVNPPSPSPTPAAVTTSRPQLVTNAQQQFTTQSTIKPACAGCGYVTTKKPLPGNKNQLDFQTNAFKNPKPGTSIIGGVYNPETLSPGFAVALEPLPVGGFVGQQNGGQNEAPFVSNQQYPQTSQDQGIQGQQLGNNAYGQNDGDGNFASQGNFGDQNNFGGQSNLGGQSNFGGQNNFGIPGSNFGGQISGDPNLGIPSSFRPGIENQNSGSFGGQVGPESSFEGPVIPQTNFESPNPEIYNPIVQQNVEPTPSTLLNPLAIPQPVNPGGIIVHDNLIDIPNNPSIPIQDKYPGMQNGLPDGVTTGDITGILYKFNYTVGFHGHYEKGYRNGAKVGGYFVNDRDGVSRIVTYVADENGYRPKVKLLKLDLTSDLVPKEGTEKTFGLKNFEFVWYPLN